MPKNYSDDVHGWILFLVMDIFFARPVMPPFISVPACLGAQVEPVTFIISMVALVVGLFFHRQGKQHPLSFEACV